MTCKTCGRDEGHWLGCAQAQKSVPTPTLDSTEVPAKDTPQCEFEGCTEPRASTAPKAKYCTTHKDPKARK